MSLSNCCFLMLRFVINLDRATNRWQNIFSQLHSLGINIQRIPAIDAREDKLPTNITAPLGHPSKYLYPKALTNGEIACYLSHIACWKALLESTENWVAILEDDILLSPRAKFFLSSPNWIPSGIHILQLHTSEKHWRCRTMPKHIPLQNRSSLYNVIDPSFGACCYLMDREAAKIALNLSYPIVAPVDEFLFNFKSPFTQIFPTWRLNPACALHNDFGLSYIGDRRLSKGIPMSVRNHLSFKRLYLSARKNWLKRFLCVDTVFTWE